MLSKALFPISIPVTLPPFDDLGNLPSGVYQVSWTDFQERFANNSHRQQILVGLKQALWELAIAGCSTVYIGGSFVTSKEQPNDFDGCFDPMTVDLYSLDPVFDSAAAQQDRFGGDLKPNPNFVGFFQTDRDGNSRRVIEIDPREVLHSP
jgi:hypothetical protein